MGIFALLLGGASSGALKQQRNGPVRRSHDDLLFCVPNESRSICHFCALVRPFYRVVI